VISKEEFRPLWLRLCNALGRPPQPDLRLEGMYEETKSIKLDALAFAVDAWVRGKAEDVSHFGRFPYPSDLIRIADAYERKRSLNKPVQYKLPQIKNMTDRELAKYMQTLERTHKENYERGKALRGGTGVGWLALDFMLKKSFGACATEWERRYGKGSMPRLQVGANGTVAEETRGDLSVLLENFLGPPRGATDRDAGQQDSKAV
jgi:hypothetical protein